MDSEGAEKSNAAVDLKSYSPNDVAGRKSNEEVRRVLLRSL